MKAKFIYTITYIVAFFTGFSQYINEKKVIIEKLSQCTTDTCKVNSLNKLSLLNQSNDFKAAYDYAVKALELAEKSNYIRGKVTSLNSIGHAYWYNNDYIQALTFYYKAYKINDSLKDKQGLAESYYNIGWIKVLQQKNHKEISYLYKSLQLYTDLRQPSGVASLMHTLGQYYCDLYLTSGNKAHFDSSYSYYNNAIEMLSNSGDKLKNQYPKFYGSLGDLFALSGDYLTAKTYKLQNLEFHLNNGDSSRYYSSYDDLAEYEFNMGNLDKAIQIDIITYNYSVRNKRPDLLLATCMHLNKFYYSKNNIKEAYKYLLESIKLKDSLDKQLFSTSLNDIQNGFEIEKREANIKELQQEKEIQELIAGRNKILLIGGAVVLLIIVMIAYFLYKRNKEKGIINKQLFDQNIIITQKKLEIESSIQYAKGIQTSFFPEPESLKEVFPESFIFYRPKDVVSGDFYWFHKVDNLFFCLAADCTGHGVPGALMSIVSVDKIAQAIFENKYMHPAQILGYINVEIKKALKQNEQDAKQKDGLDIALLCFDLKQQTMLYAGANRPLFIIRNGELDEYKADKVAIAGFTPNHYSFAEHEIKLEKGDCIYIFSDGYADQFGGTEGKKYMTKNFKQLLLNASEESMEQQEKLVKDSHSNWKGSYEQVDDILVIGIKFLGS